MSPQHLPAGVRGVLGALLRSGGVEEPKEIAGQASLRPDQSLAHSRRRSSPRGWVEATRSEMYFLTPLPSLLGTDRDQFRRS
jgi:hypothetical protein